MPERDGWHKTVGQPARHLGWVFSGPAEFESRASAFLAQGIGRRERLMYVADDPNVSQWPKAYVDRGDLLILSTSEIYGPERIVDVASQRRSFEDALTGALRDGYTGIRVFADNTTLVDGPGRLAAWMQWEDEAERFIAENPVTGLCAFDRSRADADVLQAVVGVHRELAPPVT